VDFHKLQQLPPWEWPESAGSTLRRTLLDTTVSTADRSLAAELAGDCPALDDSLLAALLQVVRNEAEPTRLRANAAIALGPVLETVDLNGFDDPDVGSISELTFRRIDETLRGLYCDERAPSEVRRSALEAAVRAPQDWHAAAIRAALASDDAAWRVTAVFCMRFVRGFEKEILAALDATQPQLRLQAVHAAGAWELQGAFERVATLIRPPTPDKALLLAAIEAAANLRPKAAPELLSKLEESRDEDIAAAVEEALAIAGAREDDSEDEADF
jgi:hypothetical protein